MNMQFNKYKEKGAYHWKYYSDINNKYRKHVDRIIAWIPERSICDIGAGDGLITYKLDAIGIDNDETGVRLAQEKGANVILGDAYNTKFTAEQFQAVTMFDVLEHFDDPEKAVLEAKRILITGGSLYISTPPLRDSGKLTDKYHIREWSPESLQNFIENCGFEQIDGTAVYSKEKIMYCKFKKQ